MPIAVRITPQKMSKDDYETMMRELEQRGCGEPDGRLSHASYGTGDVHVFETWDSHESFTPYHNQLMDVLDGAGFDSGCIEVAPLQGRIG
jgi:hypothetical protein